LILVENKGDFDPVILASRKNIIKKKRDEEQ
jgi:hypothetical protein